MQHAATIAERELAWLPGLSEHCVGVQVAGVRGSHRVLHPYPMSHSSLEAFQLQCLTYLVPQGGCWREGGTSHLGVPQSLPLEHLLLRC